MKRILLVATVQSHIAQFHKPLIELLKEEGFEIHVAGKDNLEEKKDLRLEKVDKKYSIAFERNPMDFRNIKAYKQLKRIIEKNDYSIVHCNTPVGGALTRIAVKKIKYNKPKVFYTAHGFHFFKGSSLKNWILYYPVELYLSKYTDKLITINNEDYLLASKKFKTNVYHIRGVGVDTSKYYEYTPEKKEIIRDKFGFSSRDFIILNVGELNQNKNQKVIIDAFNLFKKKSNNVHLLIAGNGPEEKRLKEKVKELGLEANIHFLGYTRKLPEYYNISNVLISSSFREGLPQNVLEALQCNVPVIASSNRGHCELISPEVGFLVEDIQDPREYAEYLGLVYGKYSFSFFNEKDLSKFVIEYTEERVKEELKKIYGFI